MKNNKKKKGKQKNTKTEGIKVMKSERKKESTKSQEKDEAKCKKIKEIAIINSSLILNILKGKKINALKNMFVIGE